MKRTILLACAVAIAGCSTPTMPEMRSKGAVSTYKSAKNEAELAKCILFAWQDGKLSGGGMPMGMQPGRASGVSVYAGQREYFADVSSTPQGSVVSYYEVSNSWVSKALKSELEACL
ncbi:lipoprotein [Pseudomonas sp. VLB120]|nr:lipoprotein [Pseudomonas sp. VLB120]